MSEFSAETLGQLEASMSLKNTAIGLNRRQDAGFDGNSLRIGFLEKNEQGQNLPDKQKKDQAEGLAKKLNNLKDNGQPILGREITPEEILELPNEIQKLISERKFAALLVNILGNQAQNSEASALAMVAFLEYVKDHPNLSQKELLENAYGQVAAVLKAAGFKPEDVSFAGTLVLPNGKVVAINTGGQEIVIIGKDGEKKASLGKGQETDGKPLVQSAQMRKGEKIVLCAEGVAERIDGTKKVGEIVSALTSQKEDPSSTAGETEGERKESLESAEASREKVIKIFDKVYTAFEEAIRPIEKKWQNNPSSLTPREKAMLEDYQAMRYAVKNHDKNYQVRVEVKDADGKFVTLREGVPVEGLIDFLEGEIQRLASSSNSQDKVKLKEYKRYLSLLEQNSRPFPKRHERTFQRHPGLREERVRLEAYIRSQDEVRRSTNPDDEERMREDWFGAELALARRRELVLPEPGGEERRKVVQMAAPAEAEAEAPEGPEELPPTPVAGERGGEGETLPRVDSRPEIPHKPPYYADLEETITVSDFITTYPEQMSLVDNLLKQMEGMGGELSKNSGESDLDYELRLLDELAKRLRFPGDYKSKPDPIFSLISNYPQLHRPDLALMAVEATRAIKMREANRNLLERFDLEMSQVKRTAVHTEVIHAREPAYVSGDYESYFDDKRKPRELPQTDLYAFALVADRLLDVIDPVTEGGKLGKSYRDQMRELENIIESSSSTPQQKAEASRKLVSLRSQFYSMAIEAMQTLDQPHYVNTDPNTQSDRDKVLLRMYEKLHQIRSSTIDDLINQYQGVTRGLSKRGIDRMKELLGNQRHLLLEFALKGGDLMKRRISYAPRLYEVPDKIHYKKFVQKERDVLEDLAGLSHRRTPQRGIDEIPPPLPPESPAEPQVPRKEGGEGEALTPAPPKKEEEGPAEQREGEAQPPTKAEEGALPVEVPTTLVFGAYTEGGKHAVQQAHDLGFAAEANVEELFRRRGLLGGRIAITDRIADGFAQFGFKIKKTVRVPLLGTALSVPPIVLSNTIRIVRHPVKSLVRGIFKPFFDQQNYNFGADVAGIIQEKVAEGDSSIPIDISEDLVHLVLKKGSERRNRGFFRKIKNNFLDLLSDLSLGHIQTSEQREGKKWLREQLADDLPEDQRDPELQQLIQAIKERSLAEQDAEGQRFALLGYGSLEEMREAGLTLDEINRRVLAQGGRETRYSLADVDKNLYQEANNKLKALIEEYVTAITKGGDRERLRRELVRKVNEYLIGENYPGGCLQSRLPEEYQKEFSGFQVVSNILTLADKVAEAWNEQGYLRKEDGQTVWNKTKLDILFGKGEWHGRRGGREYGKVEGLFGLQEKILQEIAKRKLGLREQTYHAGLSIARRFLNSLGLISKEGLIYGGSFLLGLKASALVYAPSTILGQLFKGTVLSGPVAGVAALRERGLDIPWLTEATGLRLRGRLELDRNRLSRQMALRRTGEAGAIVRGELEEALVKPVAASDLTREIEMIIGTDHKGELNPQKAAQLLRVLAEADARLGMTDRSGRRELKFRVQNFVSYTEGKEGEEYLRLKQALLDGQIRLMNYLLQNPQTAQQIFPGQTINNAVEFSQAFEKASALAKAQLVEGSESQVAKKIERWLQKYGEQFGIGKDEIPSLMSELFPKLNLGIARAESLARKERNWFRIRNTRAVETFLTVVAGGLITGPVIQAEIGELRNLYGDIQHAGGNLWAGIAEYGREWVEVLRGDVPVEINQAGQVVADLSLCQKAGLFVRNMIEPPPDLMGVHHTQIDGVDLELPGGLRYREVGDLNGDGVAERLLVDLRTGAVVKDLSGFRFALRDLNGDGQLDLAMIDGGGKIIDATAEFQKIGITVTRGPDIAGSPQTLEVIKPTDVSQIENPITHQKMEAPRGVLANGHPWEARWVQDGTLPDGTPKYDLKIIDTVDGSVVRYQGQEAVLVNDARFDANGHLIGYNQATSLGKMVEMPSSVVGVSEVRILTPDGKIDPSGELGRHMQEIPPRHWHTEHQLQFYNFKNEQGNVVLDFRKCGGKGVFISFGGDAKHGFYLPDEIDGKLDGMVELNPHSTAVIPGSDGFTLGELTKMIINEDRLHGHGMPAFVSNSEYHKMTDLFNLAVGGKQGYIEAADPSGNIYATISGTGAVPQTIKVPTAETFTQSVNVGVLRETITRTLPTFRMTAPPIKMPTLWVIPIPYRRSPEPLKPETPAERPAAVGPGVGQPLTTPPSPTTPPPTTPTPPPAPPSTTRPTPPPIRPQSQVPSPAPEEEREGLEKERNQLAGRVAELEAALQPPTPAEEEIKSKMTEEDYKKIRQDIIDFLTNEKIEAINQLLAKAGIKELTQEEIDELRKNKKQLQEKAKEIIIGLERRRLQEEAIKRIYQEEVDKLQDDEKEVYRRYSQGLAASNDPKVQQVLGNLNSQTEARFKAEYKAKIDEEIERLRQQIEEWEKAEAVVSVTEAASTRKIEIEGHSDKGGRESDEDAYFDGKFHFGVKLNDHHLQKFGVLKRNETLDGLKEKLNNKGFRVAIVADGMGGHGNGEVASAIAIVGFIKELVNQDEINEEVLKNVVTKVNEYIQRYNQKHKVDAGTTLVAQVTDNEGNTYVVSVGNSRVYMIDEKNNCRLLTADDSWVWRLMEVGTIPNPWEMFTHPFRSVLTTSLGGERKEEKEGLTPEMVFVQNLGSVPSGTKLVLVCDGVWEGIDQDNIPEDLKKRFEERVSELESEGKNHQEARRIAAQEFFGDLFWELNLGGDIKNLDPKYLTREEVGKKSGDNTTAVVVKF